MRWTMEAVYENGIFRPTHRPSVLAGERVRLTVERLGMAAGPDDVLRLAARVDEGLSAEDITEIEEMARRNPFKDPER